MEAEIRGRAIARSGEAKWPQNFTKSSTPRGQKVMLISHLAQMNNFGVMSLKP